MAELAVGVPPLPPATAWRRALRHPSFAIGGALVLLLLATAALSWVWTPHPATEIDVAHRLELPGATVRRTVPRSSCWLSETAARSKPCSFPTRRP